MTRAGLALLLANLRYWRRVAPVVRVQLARWEKHARTIPDPALRELAIDKLREERFNVEVAATMATLAKPGWRRSVIEAIVALQVAYDYLDLLTEQPLADPSIDTGRALHGLIDALGPQDPLNEDYYLRGARSDDGGYLSELVRTTRLAFAKLPAAETIREVALSSAKRCVEAQKLSHAAPRVGTAELEWWSRREATGTNLQWPEFLAGAAASVLAIHVLIAAAADRRTTSGDAEEIDAVYLSICALTMLDSLVDREHDIATGELSYVDLYDSDEQMVTRLALVTRTATSKASTLPHAAHHVVTLAGIVAYYTSALNTEGAFTQTITKPICNELRPIITPTLVLMRVWRLAKAVRKGSRVRIALRTSRNKDTRCIV